VAWADLDRSLEPDHLTSVFLDRLAAPVSAEMARLEELVRTLRERCPWDREQTHASLTRHLVEETYEVLDAIAEVTSADAAGAAGLDRAVSHLEEELGDLLFQVYFHSRLASERGWFTLADVAAGVHDKLVGCRIVERRRGDELREGIHPRRLGLSRFGQWAANPS